MLSTFYLHIRVLLSNPCFTLSSVRPSIRIRVLPLPMFSLHVYVRNDLLSQSHANCIKCMCMASNFTNCRLESFLGPQFCTRSKFWHICHVKCHGHFTLIQAILPLVSETRDNSRSILTTSVFTSF